jgi:antitoxin (DNA-binding transcriptional repressor) of toxin-antitoxin stability system
MSTPIQISLEELQAKLPEIVHGLGEGDEVVIVEDKRPVARLLGPLPTKSRPRTPGSARGRLTVLAEDDEHLKDFGDYVP